MEPEFHASTHIIFKISYPNGPDAAVGLFDLKPLEWAGCYSRLAIIALRPSDEY